MFTPEMMAMAQQQMANMTPEQMVRRPPRLRHSSPPPAPPFFRRARRSSYAPIQERPPPTSHAGPGLWTQMARNRRHPGHAVPLSRPPCAKKRTSGPPESYLISRVRSHESPQVSRILALGLDPCLSPLSPPASRASCRRPAPTPCPEPASPSPSLTPHSPSPLPSPPPTRRLDHTHARKSARTRPAQHQTARRAHSA